jgi:hypothetical protein
MAITAAQARARQCIVAAHLDGPMPLGGLGPLWAVSDADRVPEMAARPFAQRLGHCPRALYHILYRIEMQAQNPETVVCPRFSETGDRPRFFRHRLRPASSRAARP